MPKEDPFKDAGRDEDPFKDAGRDEDPFKDAGRDEDPFKDAARGLGETAFGGGGGWVVVAFISPVGMSVPELAVRMLGGGAPSFAANRTPPPNGRKAVKAQQKARELEDARKRDHRLAQAYERQRLTRQGASQKKPGTRPKK